jgi:hypothetical protein
VRVHGRISQVTGAVQLTFPATAPLTPRIRRIGLAATSWLIAVNFLTGGPLIALWVGSQVGPSGAASMTSIVIVVLTLAAVNFSLVALLWRLDDLQHDLDGGAGRPPAGPAWLYRPRLRRQRALVATPPLPLAPAAAERAREALVLIDGGRGGTSPWLEVVPHLEFGFDVLMAVLPRSASLDGTLRAMDRAGWRTAHVVARQSDAGIAIDLARLGRASSVCVLDTEAVAEDPAGTATEIADRVAFRSPG